MKDVTAQIEIYYPDGGGYTGFSICVWDVSDCIFGEARLRNNWGSISPESLYRNSYVLEGRFFVFGSLLRRIFFSSDSAEVLRVTATRLFDKWKPHMDEVTKKYYELCQEPDRGGIHIDEILDPDTRARFELEL